MFLKNLRTHVLNIFQLLRVILLLLQIQFFNSFPRAMYKYFVKTYIMLLVWFGRYIYTVVSAVNLQFPVFVWFILTLFEMLLSSNNFFFLFFAEQTRKYDISFNKILYTYLKVIKESGIRNNNNNITLNCKMLHRIYLTLRFCRRLI